MTNRIRSVLQARNVINQAFIDAGHNPIPVDGTGNEEFARIYNMRTTPRYKWLHISKKDAKQYLWDEAQKILDGAKIEVVEHADGARISVDWTPQPRQHSERTYRYTTARHLFA